MTYHQAYTPPDGLRELGTLLAENGSGRDALDAAGLDAAVALARRHGLTPAVFPRLAPAAGGPHALAPHLRPLFFDSITGGLVAQKVWTDAIAVLGTLLDAGIRVIALKGLHLVAGGYVELRARPMGDIDLLVPPDEAWRAWRVLRENGFTAANDVDASQVDRFPLHLPRLSRPQTTPVELHRDITPPQLAHKLAVEGFWQRARPLAVGPHALLGFCPEDLLLHLCLHAAQQHRCQVPLRCVYDIARVVERAPGGIAWDALLRTARASGTERPLFCGLLLAEQVFGAPVPQDALRSLAPDADRDAILSAALDSVLHFDRPAGPLARLRAARGPLPRRVAHAARELFAGPEIIASTTRREPLLTRLGTYWRLFAKVAARSREFSGRLASGDPEAHAEMRVARSTVALETWMAE